MPGRLKIFTPFRGQVDVIGMGFGGGVVTVCVEYRRGSDGDKVRDSFELETLGLSEVDMGNLRSHYESFFSEFVD